MGGEEVGKLETRKEKEKIELEKRMWAYLNDEGIYTIDELKEAAKKLPVIDIGIAVPFPKKKEGNYEG